MLFYDSRRNVTHRLCPTECSKRSEFTRQCIPNPCAQQKQTRDTGDDVTNDSPIVAHKFNALVRAPWVVVK